MMPLSDVVHQRREMVRKWNFRDVIHMCQGYPGAKPAADCMVDVILDPPIDLSDLPYTLLLLTCWRAEEIILNQMTDQWDDEEPPYAIADQFRQRSALFSAALTGFANSGPLAIAEDSGLLIDRASTLAQVVQGSQSPVITQAWDVVRDAIATHMTIPPKTSYDKFVQMHERSHA